MSTYKYSELTNTAGGMGSLGESGRMAVSLAVVRMARGKDFSFQKSIEMGVYTFIYEKLEKMMVKNNWNILNFVPDAMNDDEGMVKETALAVQKWVVLLLIKFLAKKIMPGAKQNFSTEAFDYALAVGLRELFGLTVAGWDNMPTGKTNDNLSGVQKVVTPVVGSGSGKSGSTQSGAQSGSNPKGHS